ncbi:LON peptidase substrate-binding domain-containing protein [Geothrix sp. PMB-07]|uniref:LON peptidase substrate-binding domain-containing protein n=1 Tax=Geothrix sp. PMB-07 TaxID=3068640 RepID=UPI002741502F|nr:LON peptidase substrate-binding domain-containing protein [Geothrix sp. PMB-07]WLT33498.1 LON peptidase substrate-binding domain-containing protein [Geothrix sp. PMB-07]
MLPAILPLFPLPSVVLFPQTFLPVYIFEPRYQEMTVEVLNSHHHLILTLMRQTPEPGTLGETAPIFDVGCLAEVVRAEPLTGGRWNLLLQGKATVKITGECPGKPFRQAEYQELPFDSAMLWPGPHRRRLMESLDAFAASEGIEAQLKELLDLPLEDTDRLNTLAMALDFEPTERQFLLESPDLPTLADRMLQLLDFAVGGRSL